MTEADRAPTAKEQLAAIASLSGVLDQQAVDYWLFGGWAVDFWLGAVTREHDDIDVAAWRCDYDPIKAALEAGGIGRRPTRSSARGTSWGRSWSSSPVVADDDGGIVIPMPSQPLVWSAAPFGDDRRELLGVTSRVIPLRLLKTGKSVPRESAVEAAKDRADFQALSRLEA